MRSARAWARRRKNRVIPGFRFSLGITLLMLLTLILIPLASVLAMAFRLSFSDMAGILMEPSVMSAILVSALASLLAAFVNVVFGLVLAWVLVRYEFPGKRIVDGMIELPFALPTAVAGITLSKLYSDTGEIGGILARAGIHVSYTHLGILVALVFVGIPFVVRSVQPVLEGLGSSYEEAAAILGAGRFTTFRRVIFPELWPALLSGGGLAFARGIGEYGSVIYISGNSAKNHTQVISYIIMQKLNYLDYESAAAISAILLLISFLSLILINGVAFYQARRTGGGNESYTRVKGKKERFHCFDGILILAAVGFELLMLMMPLVSVIRNAFSQGLEFYLSAITTGFVRSAIAVSLLATLVALVVNTFFGLVSSWALTEFDFRGRQVLGALIDIPFSVSPVIAGLSFIMMFGRLGWAYPLLTALEELVGDEIQIVFALPGVLLATIFVTFPFVSRELIPVMQQSGRDEEEAAALMGAGGLLIARRVTFGHIKWPLIYGMILCMARALGEFGAVSALSKTRGETFTLPLEIDALYMSGGADSVTAAFAVSSLLVTAAVAVLIVRSILEHKGKENVS